MNQKQNKLMFNQSFETWGRTVFKVGGGFETLPGESGADLRESNRWFQSTSTFEIFQSTSIFEIFQGTSKFEKSIQILDVGLYRDYNALVHALKRLAFSKSTRTLKSR